MRIAHGPRSAAAITALTCLFAAGCSGSGPDAKSAAGPSAPASASSSPTGTAAPAAASAAPEETPPPAPAAARGDRGRRAFAGYVMDLWGYGLRTDDPGPLLALSPRKQPCAGCEAFAAELAKRKKQGWYVDFAGLDVRRVRLSSANGESVATATVDVPQSDSYDVDGSYRNTSPAHPGARFEVRMRSVEGRYRLLSFTLG